ncbi:MAG: hypothetical protein VKP63_01775 [Cyanobacteriota bacterium]|nr:hypothetical protein [Cyanobacteriota bacterium]
MPARRRALHAVVASDTFHGEPGRETRLLSKVWGDPSASGAQALEHGTPAAVVQATGPQRTEGPGDPGCAPPRGRARAGERVSPALRFADLKERQLVFRLTRQLAEAQFARADGTRSQRLWQEVADLDLDPERIMHLLYSVADHADRAEMMLVDASWRPSPPSPRRGEWWAPGLGRLMGRARGAAHRTAPPAATPRCL